MRPTIYEGTCYGSVSGRPHAKIKITLLIPFLTNCLAREFSEQLTLACANISHLFNDINRPQLMFLLSLGKTPTTCKSVLICSFSFDRNFTPRIWLLYVRERCCIRLGHHNPKNVKSRRDQTWIVWWVMNVCGGEDEIESVEIWIRRGVVIAYNTRNKLP